MTIHLSEETGIVLQPCVCCGQIDQAVNIVDVMGTPWKYIHFCQTCGEGTDANSPKEARERFNRGAFTVFVDNL